MTSVYDTNGQILLAVIGFVVFVLFLFWLWLICKKRRRNYQGKITNLIIIFVITKVIREKSRGEGSLIEQDTIENVSEPKFFF